MAFIWRKRGGYVPGSGTSLNPGLGFLPDVSQCCAAVGPLSHRSMETQPT